MRLNVLWKWVAMMIKAAASSAGKKKEMIAMMCDVCVCLSLWSCERGKIALDDDDEGDDDDGVKVQAAGCEQNREKHAANTNDHQVEKSTAARI
mmetsp:Transcript_2220/g.8150  ORF Transcript_2220/g.8150 Transcript_2220/m.8150 type:complete len:94 (+) Transcript_2220:5766-6047(+)